MSKRIAPVSAALLASALLVAGCASNPATEPSGPIATAPAASAPAVKAFTPALNLAAASTWLAEERLLPQQPILALIADGGSINAPVGLVLTCNPDNGVITARLPKQDATRVGKTAAFTMKIGAGAADVVDGKFELNARTQDASFAFPLKTQALQAVAKASEVSFNTDAGETQWAFVKDPAATPHARYIGSLKNIGPMSANFLTYCNPK
jgi:hypothetical protein